MRDQPLDQVDGAMLPPRAADRDGEIATVAAFEFRDARLQEVGDVVDQALDRGAGLEEGLHRRVPAGERLQRRLPVRIGEGPGVEDEIGIAGDARLVGEGLEEDRQPSRAAFLDPAADQFAQRVDAQGGGVDHEVGGVGQRVQQATLGCDGFG